MTELRTFLHTPTALFKSRKPNPLRTVPQEDTRKGKGATNKRIHKCSQKCKKHLFAIKPLTSASTSSSFHIHKYGIEHHFCPAYNQLIGIHEGGIPEFNKDNKIDTPTFVSKYDKFNSQMTTNKIYRQRFRENLAKATNSTREGTHPLLQSNFNKIQDHSLHETIHEFNRVLKLKTNPHHPQTQ